MNKLLTTSILTSFLYFNLFSQQQLPSEPKVYVSPQNKVYINKSQPVYFSVSTSPDPNAPSYNLPSEGTPQYANPMYLDTEGRNTLRSPSAVDKTTRKVVMPKMDLEFDVYADGIAPATTIKLTGNKSVSKNKTYYSKGLKLELSASDITSGVEKTYISLNGEVYTDYTNFQNTFSDEIEYKIQYYSVDHVGNLESPKSATFYTDLTAPTSGFKILGENKGDVISSKASIVLESKDTLSGINNIWYSINDGPFVPFTKPIPILVLKSEKSKITYYATDKAGNKEESKVIATFAGSMEEVGDRSSYGFYIDKDPPRINFEITGDQHKGIYQYLSERSRFTIVATDDKSGVDQISYSIDDLTLKNTFTEPFAFSSAGLHSVFYAAKDYVGNAAVVKTQQIYVDASIPTSEISYAGNTFVSRDTTFITSNTAIQIKASEKGSGLKEIKYTLDKAAFISYSAPIKVEKEGLHTLTYQSVDNVNNTEKEKDTQFIIDNTAPKIISNFSVNPIGEKTVRDEKYTIYPSNAMLFLAAIDNASGSEKIEYRINGTGLWLNILPIKGFKPGNYEIEIICWDMLKNKSTKTERFAIEN